MVFGVAGDMQGDFWLVEGVGCDAVCDWVCAGGFMSLPGNEPSGEAGKEERERLPVPPSIDCFVRTTNYQSNLREAMFEAIYQRWRLEPEINMRTLRGMPIREGRIYAELEARTDPYIFTDNDVLIVGKDWVKRGVEAMLAHPEYAVCSSLSLVEGENLAKGEGQIYDMHAVGAPMWIRKGILTDLPEMTLDQECGIIHKYVLDKGYKEGLINGLRHNHLGHGFSSNPSLHWGF